MIEAISDFYYLVNRYIKKSLFMILSDNESEIDQQKRKSYFEF